MKNTAFFRFYAELNYFLPPEKKYINFTHSLKEKASIKDAIETLGVPHTEIDLILVNGDSVNFNYLIKDGDLISVYPQFKSIDISDVSLVHLSPLDEYKFVLDIHLGKLANHLRLLGFDTLYRNDYADPELARISSEENRVLLTRDRPLLKRSIVTYGYYVRSTNPDEQIIEVLHRFNLFDQIKQGIRCTTCNGLLKSVDKQEILHRLEPLTKQYYNEFYLCQSCDKIYWPGSHYQHIQDFIQNINIRS